MIRVLGVGSPTGDDRAGLEVARRLAASPPPGAEVHAVDRRGADLLELLDGAESVILVDAARSGAPLGTVHELGLASLPRQPRAPLSSHGVGVQAALALADALGRELPRGVVLAIEGGTQDAMSPAVERAVDAVVARVRRLLRAPLADDARPADADTCAGTPPATGDGGPPHPAPAPCTRRRFDVSGTVQAVGFRPFAWRLADDLGLAGTIRNAPHGVTLDLEGPPAALSTFANRLRAEAPAAAHIADVAITPLPPRGAARLTIEASSDGPARTQFPPDLATCPDCLAEILDPRARRFRYPFTNCTQCGPRFTVVTRLPYDRAATTLADFALCAECAAEYADPADRRFHAEPIACPRCGPRCWLEGAPSPGEPVTGDPLAAAAALLRGGAVLAVLGVGGAHLACDATNAAAVGRLRIMKQRPHKPLAVMVATLADAEGLAALGEAERALLRTPEAPIVLVAPRPGAPLAAGIAPGLDRVGLLLAHSPLHHLLLRDAGCPLVMTSANRPGEPLAASPAETRAVFATAADALLLHDRPVHRRCDDSLWMATAGGPQPLRRARGSAPSRIAVPLHAARAVLGAGGDQKNAVCLLDAAGALLSPHVGSLAPLATQAHWRASVAALVELAGGAPAVVAFDAHPAYASRALAAALGLPTVEVQHHHAHIAACLADNFERGPVIGIAFDGTGYGSDGAVWGGEALIADLRGAERVGQLEYLPLAGGDAAVRQPLRVAAAYQLALRGAVDARTAAALGATQIGVLERMLAGGVNTVPTSSAGRLFDAVAALLGLGDDVTYEGHAAMRLEAAARACSPSGAGRAAANADDGYPFAIDAGVIGLRPLLDAVLAERDAGVPTPRIAARFHAAMVAIVVALARHARARSGLTSVALSGGCFQNRLLLDGGVAALAADGFRVLVHHQVPANDGGLALGQAVVAAARRAEPH